MHIQDCRDSFLEEAAGHLGPDVLAPHIKGEERGDRQHLASAARGDRHEEHAGDQDDARLAHQRIGAGRQHQIVEHLVDVDLQAQRQRYQLPLPCSTSGEREGQIEVFWTVASKRYACLMFELEQGHKAKLRRFWSHALVWMRHW